MAVADISNFNGEARAPLFSIVTPVYNTPLEVLQETIESVINQSYSDWEWILVDDLSPNPEVRLLLRAAAERDPRLKVIERATNGHIVAASNTGLAAAQGEFIVLLDHDDLLTSDALEVMAAHIAANPYADYLYSDEDKLDDAGSYIETFRKPDWSPERFRNQMYTCHLSVLRRSLVNAVGGFHQGFDGSQDHDLVLRVTEKARQIEHVRQVLYHWRIIPGSAAGDIEAKPYAWYAGQRAVQAHLERMGISASAELGPSQGNIKVVRDPLPTELAVSVIIPTRGSRGTVWGEDRVFVVEAVRSILAKGGHANLEIIVVYDTGTPPEALSQLKLIAGEKLKLVNYDREFNFSEKCNLGVEYATSNYLILLNDDTEISGENFVGKLVAPLLEPGVGITGPRLLHSDSTIQQAGITIDPHHGYVHAFSGLLDTDLGPFGELISDREVLAVTGACLAVKKCTYEQVGGMTSELPNNYNDVDLCNKIRQLGLRVLWVWDARVFHFESKTREPNVQNWEKEYIASRWRALVLDPYCPSITSEPYGRFTATVCSDRFC